MWKFKSLVNFNYNWKRASHSRDVIGLNDRSDSAENFQEFLHTKKFVEFKLFLFDLQNYIFYSSSYLFIHDKSPKIDQENSKSYSNHSIKWLTILFSKHRKCIRSSDIQYLFIFSAQNFLNMFYFDLKAKKLLEIV